VTGAVVVGLVVAGLAWAALFAPARAGFWERATVAGLVIGTYGVVAQRGHLGRLLRPTVLDVAIGAAGAVALYGVFWAGDRMLHLVVPDVARQIGELYTVRASAGRWMPLVLMIVGPCEELFWRGFVQDRAGVAVALVGYAAVHLWERKVALILAAVVGGAAWSALFAWRGSLIAPIVCHALWDLAVVVWFPFRPPDHAEPAVDA